eukprot:3718644-Rhodomonas_salina.2
MTRGWRVADGWGVARAASGCTPRGRRRSGSAAAGKGGTWCVCVCVCVCSRWLCAELTKTAQANDCDAIGREFWAFLKQTITLLWQPERQNEEIIVRAHSMYRCVAAPDFPALRVCFVGIGTASERWGWVSGGGSEAASWTRSGRRWNGR